MSANPLSKEQIEQLKAAQAAIPIIRNQISMARRAGIDVTEQEAQLATLEADVKRLLSVYGSLPPAE